VWGALRGGRFGCFDDNIHMFVMGKVNAKKPVETIGNLPPKLYHMAQDSRICLGKFWSLGLKGNKKSRASHAALVV
jgi:hypothetical protein